MGSRDEKDSQQGGNWQTQEVADCGMGWARLQLEHPTGRWLADPAAPHLQIDKLGGTAGSEADLVTQGSSAGK